MNERKVPTREAIEAALTEYHSEMEPEVGELTEQMKFFFGTIFSESPELKSAIMGLASALLSDVTAEEFDIKEVQRLALSGRLDAEYLFKVLAVCSQFFWVGWHARGASEEAVKLMDIFQV